MRWAVAFVLTGWLGVAASEFRVLQVTDGASDSRGPAWSPDGARIAFESNREGNWDVYMLNVTSGTVESLISSDAVDRYPAWSSDGGRIVFVSDRGGAPDLYLYDFSTDEVELLAEVPGEELFPTWTADGDEITFTRQSGDAFELLGIRPGSSEPHRVIKTPGRDLWPRWSPDGRLLAFFSRRDTQGEDDEVYVLELATDDLIRLTNRPGHDFCPAWNSAGDRLVIVSVESNGDRSLRILDLDGEEKARIAAGYHRVTEPTWAPDDRSIAYAGIRAEGEPYQLFIERVP